MLAVTWARALIFLAVSAVASMALALAATGADSAAQKTTLTVYSGREEKFVKPLLDRFTRLTKIELKVRYGDSAELAATIGEEGKNSPADVFFSQDAGAIGAIAQEGRLKVLPAAILNRVPKRFRAAGKRWVGVSGRARVVAYNRDALKPSQLPQTIWGYTRPAWKGKIGLPPTNSSFQAFVTAMRLSAGNDRTRDWLTAIKANDAKFYARNSQVIAAVASREVEVGFVNHYYLYQLREEQPNAPVANYFLTNGDPGALVNVAGAGILTSSKRAKAAARLLAFLLSKEGQNYFANGPGRAEYPLVAGIKARAGLPPLSKIQGPRISFWRLGRELPSTLKLLNEVGYTR